MKQVHVDMVTYDGKRVTLKQGQERFPMIYRAARGVYWDNASGLLYMDKRHNDSTLETLLSIVTEAVQNEYGIMLVIDEETFFQNEEKY